MNKLLRYFQKIDMIGPEIGLEHNNSNRFKSTVGATISSLIILTCTIIAFMFGLEVYNRNLPTVAISQELLKLSSFKISQLNLTVQLYNINGEPKYNILDYLSFKVSYVDIDPIKGVSFDYTTYKAVNTNGTVNFITDDVTISNDLYSYPSSTLRIHVFKCDFEIKNCAEDIEEVFDSLYIAFIFNSNYLDSINYLEPVRSFTTAKSIPISDELTKNIEINVKNNYIESDNGWLIENKVISHAFTVDEFIFKYNIVDEGDKTEKIIFQFASPNIIHKTTRSYMKIQQLFALIGGLVSGITILAQIVFFHYLRFSYLVYFGLDELDKYDKENIYHISHEFNKKFCYSDRFNKLQYDLFKNTNNNNPQNINYKNVTTNKLLIENMSFSINDIINNDIKHVAKFVGPVYNSIQNNKNIASNSNLSRVKLSENKSEINSSNTLLLINNKDTRLSNLQSNDNNIIINENFCEIKSSNNKLDNVYNELNNNVISKNKFEAKSINEIESNNNALFRNTICNNINVESKFKIKESIKNNAFELSQIKRLTNVSRKEAFNPNYFKFIISLVFCQKKEIKLYSNFLNRIEKSLDIKTYKSLFSELQRITKFFIKR